MSRYVYVLIGERGEYEDFYRDVLGVYSSHEAAREAIPKLRAYGDVQWAQYQKRDQAVKDYLSRFEPHHMGNGIPFYRNEQYAEAEAACGPRPAIICNYDTYIIERHGLDAIEVGTAVEEIDGKQTATSPLS